MALASTRAVLNLDRESSQKKVSKQFSMSPDFRATPGLLLDEELFVNNKLENVSREKSYSSESSVHIEVSDKNYWDKNYTKDEQ